MNGVIADDELALAALARIVRDLQRRKFYGRVILPMEAGKMKRLVKEESVDLQAEAEGASVSPTK